MARAAAKTDVVRQEVEVRGEVPADNEAKIRELVRTESVDVLERQIEVERKERSRNNVHELAIVAAVVGVFFGSGYYFGQAESPKKIVNKVARKITPARMITKKRGR